MNNTVTAEMLEDLIATAPTTDGNGRERTETAANGHFTHNAAYISTIDLERVLADSGIEVHARKPVKEGGTLYEVDCLTSSAHDDGAFFIQYPSGATHYGCHHASCNGKGWQDVKHLLKLPKKPRLTVNGKEAGGSGKTAEPRAVGLKLRKASEIDPLEIEWLWRPWAPYGMLSLFAGYGGSGKSTVALAIAAAATTGGTLPDGKTAPLTNVLILAAEDSPEHTLIPRLIALGTDLDRVHIVDGVVRDNDEPGWIQLREHMPLIEATVRAENIGLVIIDPISSYIGDANGDKESDVRSALMPLVQMAERTGAAVLAIRHVSKGGDSHRAASRILGSTAWHDVPRIAWMLADAPEDHQPEKNEDGTRDVKRVLGVVKSNIAAKPAARWGIQPADGAFRWLSEPSPVTVDECFRSAADSGSTVKDAEAWLKERLAGGMQRSSQVEQAAKDAGISKRTLVRARAALNVKTRKDADGWWLQLPPQLAEPESEGSQESKDANSLKGGTLGILENQPKNANVAPLAPFPQPRGNSDIAAEHGHAIQECQESKDANNANLRNLAPLTETPPEPEEEWSLEF